MPTKIPTGYRIVNDNLFYPWLLGDVFNIANTWYKLWALPIIRREVACEKANLACDLIDAVYSGATNVSQLSSGEQICEAKSVFSTVSRDVDARIVDGHGQQYLSGSDLWKIDITV